MYTFSEYCNECIGRGFLLCYFIELSLKVYRTLFVHNFIIVHSNNKLALGYK